MLLKVCLTLLVMVTITMAELRNSQDFYYDNGDTSSLLDQLLNQDLSQKSSPLDFLYQGRDYQTYNDVEDTRPRYHMPNLPSRPEFHHDLPSPSHDIPHPKHLLKQSQNGPQPPLKFPQLTTHQKQFGVHPGLPEFYKEHPDFLQYNLEEMDEGLHTPESSGPHWAPGHRIDGEDLEHQLQAIQEHQDLVDTKRAQEGPRADPLVYDLYGQQGEQNDDLLFTTIVAVSTAASVFIVVGAGFCYHRSAQRSKSTEDVEYPAYGVTGPAKATSPAQADRKLAQSAQMYHYQHQKNQMIGLGGGSANGGPGAHSGGEESEGEGEEGDYTVYECPGLASTDEMEVKNPLFNDDPTPKNP